MDYFIFNTVATMKEYNHKKWYIDSNIIPQIKITAENLESAFLEYVNIVNDKCYCDISKNATKHLKPVYQDTKNGTIQSGFTVTASTDFFDENTRRYTKQYIDLWIEPIQAVSLEYMSMKTRHNMNKRYIA